MKKALIVFMLLAASTAYAGDPKHMSELPKSSPEFQRIKALAGHWTGQMQHTEGKTETVTVDYKVTSGGTAVVETLGPGSETEMVSVYHDQNGKLVMTHYCMVGNQPLLELKSSDAKTIALASSDATQRALAGQQHMDALTLGMPDADHLTHSWSSVDAAGKPSGTAIFTLQRS